jgi:hypothetical protein
MVADPGYDDQFLYESSLKMGIPACMSYTQIQEYARRKTATG